MYIHVRPTSRDRALTRTVHHLRRCPCDGGSWQLGQPPAGRQPLKEKDVPITGTGSTAAIAKRARIAVMNLSRSYEPILYNTARRLANGDVPLRFLEEVRPKDARDLLLKEGKSDAEIKALLKTHRLVKADGFGTQPIPKGARAFEQNGAIYVPADADVADLELDLPHEVNHAMNPIAVDRLVDPGRWVWEKFKGEVRAAYAVNYRAVEGLSNKGAMSYRLEQAIQHALQPGYGFTTMKGWDPGFATRIQSWTPDGNLDNSQ